MFHFITISDEALMRWFIQILLPIELNKFEQSRLVLNEIDAVPNCDDNTDAKMDSQDFAFKKPY
jgi:hypothetical protein